MQLDSIIELYENSKLREDTNQWSYLQERRL